jgi:hypothetical protein
MMPQFQMRRSNKAEGYAEHIILPPTDFVRTGMYLYQIPVNSVRTCSLLFRVLELVIVSHGFLIPGVVGAMLSVAKHSVA